ncbi:MAG: GNAT family N-acetyltransferase [Gammaproteobacteria bacterium]|nr:GNAT family N-acetyltransferase [Gammaproteobacteria bacterium]
MSSIKINELIESEWNIYKLLRLASLRDAPDSFVSTFEREVEFTEKEWKSRIKPAFESLHVLPLVAEFDGSPVGLASGVVHTSESVSAHVYQMWVSQEYRGNGIGRALLSKIEAWAQAFNLCTLSLEVTINNMEAVYLYISAGFVPSGSPQPLRENSPLLVQPMELKLGANNA